MDENISTLTTEGPGKKGKGKRVKNLHLDWKTTKKERLAYYIGDTARLFNTATLTNFLAIFLLFQGISMASVATVILILKIIDAVDDVLFGYIVDRINPARWKFLRRLAGEGKYMPWYRVSFFLFPIATILFFLMPTGLSEGMKIVWFTVFYLLYDFTCTVSEVPMNSLVMTLTDNVEERDNILKIKGILVTVAAVVISIVWLALISENVGLPITGVAIVSAIIFLILMIPLSIGVKEHNTELKNVDPKSAERYSFKDMLNAVKTNKYMTIVLISRAIGACTATGLVVQTFAAHYLFGNSLISTVPMLIAFIPAMYLMAKSDKIAKKLGLKNSLILLYGIYALIYFVLYLIGYNNMILALILITLGALPGATVTLLGNFIAPNTIEYTRYKTGKDCSGIFYALNSFVGKATGGVASALAFFILGLSKWVPVEATDFADLAAKAVTQPPSAMTGLWVLMALVPAIGVVLSTLVFLFYNLKDSDAQLMAKCNGGEITREECDAQLSRQY
jgi:glycoside/pentoside/hexuronide:cation symporter, GPH family